MAETLVPDICVIGGGPGGLSVPQLRRHLCADGAGSNAARWGRLPQHRLRSVESLAGSGERAESIRGAGAFGLDVHNIGVHFAKVHDHVHSVIAAVAPMDSAERFTGLGVRVHP
jgi:hypothetical protein